ncbi:polyketide synthase [Penicillium malachiteum]|uniref:polyketide synthase n=1 Tax=Penicillium malachiteum TaxID=1324776 RepID=UPI0025499CD9|nr:polyketide synthase [Penicillium malachiteum]KAJ5737573.1 polyketide synthase [Penicillium malachiteum]
MDTPSSISTSTDIERDLRHRLIFFGNDFPSDNLADLFRRLHRWSKDAKFRVLALFLDESIAVLNTEISQLSQNTPDKISCLQNVVGLVSAYEAVRTTPIGGALESSLLCILQIGALIGSYEAAGTKFDLVGSGTTVCGLSIGLLTAAALASSSSISCLAYYGVESMRVAFRMAIYVDHVSHSLEAREPDTPPKTWAYVITGIKADVVQQELDRYNVETSTPNLLKVFISAADSSSVSVTGPPSRLLNALHHSAVLRYSKHLPLPVYNGLCHADHLYCPRDATEIVCFPQEKADGPVLLPVLSAETGKPYCATQARQLWEEVVYEILTRGIFLDRLTGGIVEDLGIVPLPQVEISLLRASIVSKGIIAGIKSHHSQTTIKEISLIEWCHREEPDFFPANPQSPHHSKLAVVGMSCRLPGGANDLELFWKLMEDGRDVHTRVPPDRFDVDAHYDPTGNIPNSTQTPYGNFIDCPGMFDANFFNMSPKEAEQTDPMHRLALVTAYEALEMAGYAPNRTPSTNLSRIGTYYGQASDDWRELNAGQNIGTYAVPGGERAFANGRIHYFFKFGGPTFNIDTACSSGLAAVNAACSALWAGEVDTAIAGGLSVITNPDNYAMLCRGHFLSHTGQCKVWDKDADGYCRADGIGSVVIKRLEDAVADNDNIIAVIDSAATNQSAEAISITHPHAGAQKENYQQVMNAAGINPTAVSYVELHGTGTQAGDAVESESVLDVFANPKIRRQVPLLIGAVKSNLGHGEAAAGVTSLLKVLLMYEKGIIPPHVGIKSEMNPVVAQRLERCQASLALENIPWPRKIDKKRFALVNSFGAHGGNTTLLLEDAPQRVSKGTDPRLTHVITLSAKSKTSLKANIENLRDYILRYPRTKLGDLAYTTCVRRIHHHTRVTMTVSTLNELEASMEDIISSQMINTIRPVSISSSAVPFTFTGQGASYPGMGSQLYENLPLYRNEVSELDRLVQSFNFSSVLPYILDTNDKNDIFSPMTTQLAILVTEIALTRLWAYLGISPSVVIGHSLGEYAAFVAADILSAADAIFLVGKRAELLLDKCQRGSHGMLAIRAGAIEITKLAPTDLNFEISCMNTPKSTVLGGPTEDIRKLRDVLDAAGYSKCTLLDVSFAFHTEQMDSILDVFENLAQQVSFRAPSVPVLSPLLGDCIFDGKTINSSYLRRASREPVRFFDAIEAGRDLSVIDESSLFIEIGPHTVNGSFIRSVLPKTKTLASLIKNENDLSALAGSLAVLHNDGLSVNWNAYFKPYEQSHRLLRLPTYSWNMKNYWIQYVGTWTLEKAYPQKTRTQSTAPTDSSFKSSSIHCILSEEIDDKVARMTAISDIMHPELRAAVDGHTMNGFGVASSSIWGDMAFTAGEYLYKRARSKLNSIEMDITELAVYHAQIAHTDKSRSQALQIEASLDLTTDRMSIYWYNILSDKLENRATEPYATATVILFTDAAPWRKEWSKVTHLVNSRIESLDSMVHQGVASRLSHNMTYDLFKNVVDYSEHYRGMQSVVLNGLEAYADITLNPDRHGIWHTPPHWIDSIFHLGGFVLNGSDASNTQDYFYVTPGWGSCRISQALEAGGKYRSYVRMAPSEEKNMYSGDVYVLQGGTIIGMMSDMRFRRVPRVLMNQFFSPPDDASEKPIIPTPVPAKPVQHKAAAQPVVSAPACGPAPTKDPVSNPSAGENVSTPENNEVALSVSPIVGDCLKIIARETGLDISELTDGASFVELGVDSLMSLVLSEKFRQELNLEVKSSIFIECPNIGELKAWLDQ